MAFADTTSLHCGCQSRFLCNMKGNGLLVNLGWIGRNILGECCYYLRNYNFICLCVKLKPFPFHQAVTQSQASTMTNRKTGLSSSQESTAPVPKIALSSVLAMPRKAAVLGHSGKIVENSSKCSQTV